MNFVTMRGKFRSDFGFNFLANGIGIGGIKIREYPLGSIEKLAGSFQSNEGIVETRFLRVVCDRVYVLELFLHAGFDRRGEMLVLDLIERGHVIGQRAFGEQRIIGGGWRRILHG